MDTIVETKCYNCGTIIKVNLSDTNADDTVFCPKCNLAQSHLNKIIQDRGRFKRSPVTHGNG